MTTAQTAATPNPLGVLAFGDSITNAGGELQWGVALQSWALWVARGLGLPYTSFATDGARAVDVVSTQIPMFERVAASGDARYDLGCLYIGVNDVRALDWDAEAFAADFMTALTFLQDRCERVLTVTAPLDLGRPRAPLAKVHELNAVIERAAAESEALVLDLRSFGARNHVMVDHVHPTAFGQISIAERALAVLERDGLRARVTPASLIEYETTRWKRLRGDATYVYRHLKLNAAAAIIALRAVALRAAAPPPPSPPAGGGREKE
jgi:lysophospholipase L1-like esterase